MAIPTYIFFQNFCRRQNAFYHPAVKRQDEERQDDAANAASKNARPKNEGHQSINNVAQTDVKDARSGKNPNKKA